MAGKIRQIVYVSHLKEPMDLEVRSELLKKARHFNEEHGVTGILFYKEGQFLQLLEGAIEVLDQVMVRIRNDRRHEGIFVLTDHLTESERIFPGWYMGFYHFSSVENLIGPGILKNDDLYMITSLLARPALEPTSLLMNSFWFANWKDIVHKSS